MLTIQNRLRFYWSPFVVLLTALSVFSFLIANEAKADVAHHAAAVVSTQIEDQTPTTRPLIREGDSPLNDILPRPNSGQAPEHANDRGGWQQYAVMAAICAGIGVITLLVVRESRRSRSRSSDHQYPVKSD